MDDVISGMTGPQLIGFVAVVGGLTCVLIISAVGIAVPFLTWTRRVEARIQLKRDLVSAGFSASDIERIVKAGAG
jgi:hypothetical protein